MVRNLNEIENLNDRIYIFEKRLGAYKNMRKNILQIINDTTLNDSMKIAGIQGCVESLDIILEIYQEKNS